MEVIPINADCAEEFVARQCIAAILYYTPGDLRIDELIREFRSIASTFEEHVAFGSVDLTAADNLEFLEKQIVVVTPTVIYYRFGMPAEEDVGHEAISKWLNHESLVHRCGHTDAWLRMLS